MKNTNTPLVSVILPFYNSERYLGVSIESILTQTYRNFELILIDDASTDNSPKIAFDYKKRYPKLIKIITLNKNQNCGGDSCANEGLKIAQGELIARMDADDIAVNTRLKTQVDYLTTHPKTFLVGSNAFIIDQNGDVIGEKIEPTTTSEIYRSYSIFHPLIHPSCMFRRITSNTEFRYNIKYSANNDYNTFFQLLCEGKKFVNLPEKLLYYRIHGNNDTLRNIKKKYLNTLKIRLNMVLHFGYRPTPKAILMNIIQSTVFLVLPEKILINLYLFTKGIKQIAPSTALKPYLFTKTIN